jgi:hypothetical protein
MPDPQSLQLVVHFGKGQVESVNAAAFRKFAISSNRPIGG